MFYTTWCWAVLRVPNCWVIRSTETAWSRSLAALSPLASQAASNPSICTTSQCVNCYQYIDRSRDSVCLHISPIRYTRLLCASLRSPNSFSSHRIGSIGYRRVAVGSNSCSTSWERLAVYTCHLSGRRTHIIGLGISKLCSKYCCCP